MTVITICNAEFPYPRLSYCVLGEILLPTASPTHCPVLWRPSHSSALNLDPARVSILVRLRISVRDIRFKVHVTRHIAWKLDMSSQVSMPPFPAHVSASVNSVRKGMHAQARLLDSPSRETEQPCLSITSPAFWRSKTPPLGSDQWMACASRRLQSY